MAIDTEDFGAILLRFKGGARGVLTVSQVTAGRKNCLRYEVAGAKKALYFNSEAPNSLWIGERGEANRELMRDPSLLDADAARFASYPGGHNEGFPDTFKQLYRAVYTDVLNGAAFGASALRDLRGRPPGSARLRGDCEEPPGAPLGDGWRVSPATMARIMPTRTVAAASPPARHLPGHGSSPPSRFL